MKKDMKIRIMTALMAGTFAFGFMAGPLSSYTPGLGSIYIQAAEASTEKKADLTYEEARKIALADAGLEDKDVTWYETNRDFDDDRQLTIWDLGFYHGDTEYDYDINIATGEIVEKGSDIMDAEDKTENHKKAEALKEALNKNTVNKEREQQGGFPFAALFCFRGNSDFKYNKIITHAADVPDSHTFWRIIYIFAAQIPSIVKMMEISKIYP